MRQMLQQTTSATNFSRPSGALRRGAFTPDSARMRADSWGMSWPGEAAPSASSAAVTWWTDTDEGSAMLQRLALAHIIVGVCVALALGWQVWRASGTALTPMIGLIVAVGGALALLIPRLNHPDMPLWARLALVAVDVSAAGGILWLRGGEGWTLLVLLPPIALAVTFFAERGGALATMLAALLIVALNTSRNVAPSGWMPSLFVFLGVAALVIAFLGIYSAQITETSVNLRWLLADARATSERLHGDRRKLLVRLRSVEQAQEPLLHERARLGDAAAELTMLAQRLAQGDPSAAQAVQIVRPGAYGLLAELASALAQLARMAGGNGNGRLSALTVFDGSVRAQGQALEALDMMTRALCVGANELVTDAQALAPGVGLTESERHTRARWQLEDRLRMQAASMALLGTQLADIRTSQENLEAALARAVAGAKTPAAFGVSDVRPISHYSGPQVTFGSSAIRRANAVQAGGNGTVGTVR